MLFPPVFIPPPPKRGASTRTVRGLGSSYKKKGGRYMGCMWLHIRRAYFTDSRASFVRGAEFNENLTMGEFIAQVIGDIRGEDGFQYDSPCPSGELYISVERNRKRLGDEPEGASITSYFDGGESLSVKVYDEAGEELVVDLGTREWSYK